MKTRSVGVDEGPNTVTVAPGINALICLWSSLGFTSLSKVMVCLLFMSVSLGAAPKKIQLTCETGFGGGGAGFSSGIAYPKRLATEGIKWRVIYIFYSFSIYLYIS